MRLAVFADVHGNAIALDAMVDDLRHHPADALVCLGDAIQGGPQPAEVVERLRALGCPVVMGNADAFLLSGVDTGGEAVSEERRVKLQEVREWSLSRLASDQRDFIAAFQPTVPVPLDAGRALLAFHGTPGSFDEILLPSTADEAFARALEPHPGDVFAGGHVHLQFVRRFGERFHFNPGSVGLAYRHGQSEARPRLDPWAEYAVLSDDGGRVALEFRRVPIDVPALARVLERSGRPHADDLVEAYRRQA